MKLGRTMLRNSDRELMDMLARRDWLTPEIMVKAKYENSKQPEKKAATFTKHLRRLQRFGYVREVQGAWALTAKGEGALRPTTTSSSHVLRLTP